jgi:2-oxoglutarate ferredoxin oxidoreductase subunit beta
VTFNDHEGSTKSYAFTREHEVELAEADFVPLRREITMPAGDAAVQVVQMHDGSTVRFRRLEEGYDPTNRDLAYAHVRACQARGEMATGLLFIDENGADMHAVAKTVDTPLAELPFETLCPGQTALQALMEKYR